jgi:hypothetical protein
LVVCTIRDQFRNTRIGNELNVFSKTIKLGAIEISGHVIRK